MPFNINDFRSEGLVYGGARPSLFEVDVVFPTAIEAPDSSRRLSFLARASQIPAMSLGTVEVPYFGRRIKLAGDRVFSDWSISVMNDEDFYLRSIFEKWSNAMNRIVGNVSELGPQEAAGYKGTAIVKQYSKRGASTPGAQAAAIRSYKFVGIFPTTIDAISLDWDATNQIQTYGVTFAYDWWEPEDKSGPGADAVDYTIA
jgi:hypothetical protein